MDLLGSVFGACICTIAIPIVLWLLLSSVSEQRRKEARAKYDTDMAVYDRALDLSDIDDMEGHDFEQFVAKRLVNEGYTDVEVTQDRETSEWTSSQSVMMLGTRSRLNDTLTMCHVRR